MTQEDFSAVCPYLGLADDADSHATYATEAHRCYRLPNPTRIASPHQESYCLGANHVTCPVYLGEGVPKTAPVAAAGPFTTGAPSRPVDEGETVRGPQSGQRTSGRRPIEPGPGAPATGAVARPGKRATSPGSLGPRPRAGGVSMPVATIGLFALAVIVIALAFAINNLVGGSGNDSTPSSADVVATRAAQKATETAKAGGAPTQPAKTPQPVSQTPGAATATLAPGQTRTTTAGTGSATPGGAVAKTYTVKSGDTCGAIASANNVTLQQLLTANNKSEDDCTKLQVGDVLKLP